MLKLPKSVKRSISAHNSDLVIFADWIEASVMLTEEELAPADVTDYLLEQQIYTNQDFCNQFVFNAWKQLRQRVQWEGTYCPVGFNGSFITQRSEWRSATAHTYCLVVSLGHEFDGWSATFGGDFTEQGELFEFIVSEAMRDRFRGWGFHRTGWSRDNTTNLSDVVHRLAAELGESVGELDIYAPVRAHEAGVDVVWHLPFGDSRGGNPVFLVQCASGQNWTDKISTPHLGQWRRLISFASGPYKAFCIPVVLPDRELRLRSAQSEGLILDRYRLLRHDTPERDWLDAEVRNRLIAWLEPRVKWLQSQV